MLPIAYQQIDFRGVSFNSKQERVTHWQGYLMRLSRSSGLAEVHINVYVSPGIFRAGRDESSCGELSRANKALVPEHATALHPDTDGRPFHGSVNPRPQCTARKAQFIEYLDGVAERRGGRPTVSCYN
jgi:hypothetical protein